MGSDRAECEALMTPQQSRGPSLPSAQSVPHPADTSQTPYMPAIPLGWGDGADTAASSQGVGQLEECPSAEANGTVSHMETPLDLERWMEFGQAGGKLEQVWLCTLPSVAKSLGSSRFEKRLQEQSGVEGFPLSQFSLGEPPCHKGDESPACSCRRLHTPASAFQPWPDTSSTLPSNQDQGLVSRPSLPWSFPLAGRGPLQAKLSPEALPSPSAQMSGQLGHEGFPCSCLLLQRHPSVTPQESCTP